MATAKRFSIYTGSFIHAGGTLDIKQIESMAIETNVTRTEVIPGGLVDRAAVLTASATPRARIGTRDLTGTLNTVSISAGLAMTNTSTLRMQERSSGSTFETGATQETWTATGGFLYVDSISASQDDAQGALCNLIFVPLWDGTNDPWVHNTGINFSGVTAPAFNSQFFLGPVYHNSTEIDGITNVTVNAGVNYDPKAFNGDPFARIGAIVTRQPTITFTTAKVDAVSALDMFGRAVTSSLVVYFRKAVDSGTRVADATGSHISVTCSSGDWAHDDVSVSGNDDGTVNITVTPKGTIATSVTATIP